MNREAHVRFKEWLMGKLCLNKKYFVNRVDYLYTKHSLHLKMLFYIKGMIGMKKIILFVSSCLLAMTSVTSYAFYDANFAAKDCASYANGNLTVCFQNMSNESMAGYQLLGIDLFTDGTYSQYVSGLSANQPNQFIDISTSSLQVKQHKVSKLTFSIAKGDGNSYRIMPGCTIEITPSSVSKSLLMIHKNGEYLYCD